MGHFIIGLIFAVWWVLRNKNDNTDNCLRYNPTAVLNLKFFDGYLFVWYCI